jgi:capsular polysaccharide biosynthesis protein
MKAGRERATSGALDTARTALKRALERLFAALRARRRDLFTIRIASPGSLAGGTRDEFELHAVEDPEGVLETPASPSRALSGSSDMHSFLGYDDARIAATLDRIAVFRGAPSAETLHEVVYLPGAHCLYAGDGGRIDCSYLRAGAGPSKLAPERIRVPSRLRRVDEALVYVGSMNVRHYGHFLTESIARLWYALRETQLRILGHALDRFSMKSTFFDHFFSAARLSSERFVSLSEPVLLARVVLPYPSFVCTPATREVFEAHRLLPEAVARAFLPRNARTTAQPLYFSRAGLPADRRRAGGEEVLERELREAGFAVVRPETLTLVEQIRLVNEHEVIVGTLGSALHNLLFDVSPRRNLVCFGYADAPHANYLMIDALKSVRSLYVAALRDDPHAPGDFSHRDRVLDLELAREGLRRFGLL